MRCGRARAGVGCRSVRSAVEGQLASKRMRVLPKVSSSPSAQHALVDPHAVDLGAVGRAEVDEHEAVALGADLGVVAADVGVGEHDVATRAGGRCVMTCSASVKRSPVGSTRLPAPAPPAPSRNRPSISNAAGAKPLVDHQLDLDRAHERVALVAGVLPGGVAQLAAQRVAHLGELAA